MLRLVGRCRAGDQLARGGQVPRALDGQDLDAGAPQLALGQAGDTRLRLPKEKDYWVPIPAGKFVVKGAIKVSDVVIYGAGMWHSVLVGVDDYTPQNRVAIYGDGSNVTLADFAMYVAVLASIGPVPLAVTTNLNINFLRRPAQRDLIAEARLIKLGKRLAVGDIQIYCDGEDDMVAHATSTYSIPPPEQRKAPG